jgi:hypothetical protein
MAGDHGLSDLRFAGYSHSELADQIDALRNGQGSGTLQEAMKALVVLAIGLSDADATLRDQLQAIGVSWEGQASEGGTAATEDARIYADTAIEPVTDSARGVSSQGETFHTTRNAAPDSGTLRGPTEESTVDDIAGFFGHTTDHAKQVKATNAARDAAVDAMTGYQNNSSDALGQAQTLPVPPGMNLVAQPVDTSTHVSSVGGYAPNGSGYTPTSGLGAGGGGGATSFAPGGGGGALPQVPTTGPNPPLGSAPLTGSGPMPGGSPLLPGVNNPLAPALRGPNPMLMAEAATLMGAGGAGGAGAGAQGERLARSGGGVKGGGAGGGGVGKNGVPIGSVPDEEARAARNAERFGARTGRPGGSIMQPAAAGAGRSAEGEEDQEHVRRFGVESSDVFDDERVVAPESIGDDDDR